MTSRIADCLVEPTSVTMVPAASPGADRLGDRPVGAERCRQHHQVGARGRRSGIGADAVGEAERRGLGEGGLAAGADGDVAGEALAPHDAGERRANQPDADQCDTVE